MSTLNLLKYPYLRNGAITMRDRILRLLANGIKPADAASVVGCTPAYIHQLLNDADFKSQLTELVTNQPEDAEEKRLDIKYETTEHRILSAINESLSGAKLGELTRALEVVAKRQTEVRKLTAFKQAPATKVQIVNLTLPASFYKLQAPTIEMNSESEVIAIGGNNLAPLQAEGVKNLFTRIQERKKQNEALAPIASTMLERISDEIQIPDDF